MPNKRILKALEYAPAFRDIMLSEGTLDEKKGRVRMFLSDMLNMTFEDNHVVPPMEWILVRDACRVFRNMMANRSERLAGFSFLAYIDDLLHGREGKYTPRPSTGFLEEVEHLMRALTGNSRLYAEKPPAFLMHEGRRAARMRSTDLSHMTKKAREYMARYVSGLDPEAVRRRVRNKQRILKHFAATEREWADWKWHAKNIIRGVETLEKLVKLTDEEREAVRLARLHRIPFGITPYYLSLMDREPGGDNDRAVRAQVIPSLHYVKAMAAAKDCRETSMDFMMERDTSPIEGITRRYPMILILKPVLTCPQICVYCQRNWEIEDVYSETAALGEDKLAQAIEWIEKTPEVLEVLITGGDPFLFSDKALEGILARLAKIPHLERIRIGTRTPVTLPARVTEPLARMIKTFHVPGRREMLIVTHFEHPYEITPEAMEAVQRFKRNGISVFNQLVFTFYNSRKFEAASLRHKLSLIGVRPYYTFNTKGKEETDDFRVPIARIIQESDEEARLMPGSVRTDKIVFNVPRLGKNNLMATQHHDVISILPDGRRVYEFHPWEKKLSLVDTYVYTDVGIYEYLQRLRESGENPWNYRTIWYYY
ncbi:MAG: KamA family radical SAM protein [Thermodesulfobacteriota bacterium]